MYRPICEVWECPFPHYLANTWFDQSFKLWPTHEIRVFQYLHLYSPSHQAFRSHFIALLNGGCAPLCCCPLPLLCHHRQPGCLLQLQVKSRFQPLCAQGYTARSFRKSPGWVTPSFSVIGALVPTCMDWVGRLEGASLLLQKPLSSRLGPHDLYDSLCPCMSLTYFWRVDGAVRWG